MAMVLCAASAACGGPASSPDAAMDAASDGAMVMDAAV